MIVGVDPGGRRYGVALAHEEVGVATPLTVLDANDVDPVAAVIEIAREHGASRVVVGRPTGLSGRAGPAVAAHAAFVDALRRAGLVVEEADERLTTVIARQGMIAAGAGRRSSRAGVDAVAAQIMLQGYIDALRAEDPDA